MISIMDEYNNASICLIQFGISQVINCKCMYIQTFLNVSDYNENMYVVEL